MSTPSISKAKAKESALGASGELSGVLGISGELSEGLSSKFMALSSVLAVSMALAKLPKRPPSCVFARRCMSLSGTTTTGPPEVTSFSVAVMEERRRRAGRAPGGESISEGAILAMLGAEECGESGEMCGFTKRRGCKKEGDGQQEETTLSGLGMEWVCLSYKKHNIWRDWSGRGNALARLPNSALARPWYEVPQDTFGIIGYLWRNMGPAACGSAPQLDGRRRREVGNGGPTSTAPDGISSNRTRRPCDVKPI
jgi:hypothetical protein